jgi:cell division protein FtsL
MLAIDPLRERALTQQRPVPRPILPGSGADPARRAAGRAAVRRRLGLLLSVVLCAGVALFLVSRYAELIAGNYELQSLQAQLAQAEAANAALKASVYELSAPSRILGIAENVLKMGPATPVTVGTAGR